MSNLSTSAEIATNFVIPLGIALAHVLVLLYAWRTTKKEGDDETSVTSVEVTFDGNFAICSGSQTGDDGNAQKKFNCLGMTSGVLPVVLTHGMTNLFVGTLFATLLLYNLYLFEGYSPTLVAFPLVALPMLNFFRKMAPARQSKVAVIVNGQGSFGNDQIKNSTNAWQGLLMVFYIFGGYAILLALGGHSHRRVLYASGLISYTIALTATFADVMLHSSQTLYANQLIFGEIYLTFTPNQVLFFLATTMGVVLFQMLSLIVGDRTLYAFPILLFCALPIVSVIFLIGQNKAYNAAPFYFNMALNVMLVFAIYMLHCSFCEVGGVTCKSELSLWPKRHASVYAKQALYLLPATFSVLMVVMGQSHSAMRVNASYSKQKVDI